MYAVQVGKIVLPGRVETHGYLLIDKGEFIGFTHEKPSEDINVVDRSTYWVAPGYVDTHIHGFVGHDVMDANAKGLDEASRALVKFGTTTWVPTTLTQTVEQIGRACESVYEARSNRSDDFVGARIEGIFLEGPFFTEKHKGAQNPAHMIDPNIEILEGWQKRAHGLICRTGLAPERSGAARYCAQARDLGVVCALGHSDATSAEGFACIEAGATTFIHVYNGMSGLHHRNPGLVACAMASSNTYGELICDGMHIVPDALTAFIKAKGWEHTPLVTDCLRCGGMPEGNYMLGDFPIRMQDNLARLVMPDGSLGSIAGSVLTLNQAVKNVVDWNIATAEQAIRMATEVAAQASGIDDVCGQILPGRHADFNILDNNLNVVETYLSGACVQTSSQL